MQGPFRIMNTGGHPADAFDNVGGTLANHVARGDQVTVVVMSHGVFSHDLETISAHKEGRGEAVGEENAEGAIQKKEQEVREGCKVLGIQDVRFLRFRDDYLQATPEIVRRLAEIVREVRPHFVITHNPYDGGGLGGAHGTCAAITLRALEMASGHMPGNDSRPHATAQVFFSEHYGMTTSLDFHHNRFPMVLVDITDVIEKKVRAMDCLKSQFYPGALARKVLECKNGFHGFHHCIPYAEAFTYYLPEVHKYLPVSPHRLRYAGMGAKKELYAELSRFIVPFVPYEKNNP